MDILREGVIQGLFVLKITYLIPVIYSVTIAFCIIRKMKKLDNKDNQKSLAYILSSLILRLVLISAICMILSLLSIWNYYSILENPMYNKGIYLDKLGAIFADRNNNESGLSYITLIMVLIGLPITFIWEMGCFANKIPSIHKDSKVILPYVCLVINGFIVAIACYLLVNMLMGV